jgi:hypothetical protein
MIQVLQFENTAVSIITSISVINGIKVEMTDLVCIAIATGTAERKAAVRQAE